MYVELAIVTVDDRYWLAASTLAPPLSKLHTFNIEFMVHQWHSSMLEYVPISCTKFSNSSFVFSSSPLSPPLNANLLPNCVGRCSGEIHTYSHTNIYFSTCIIVSNVGVDHTMGKLQPNNGNVNSQKF